MECPKCKYNNPVGATHCQLCYEVFNRSAADRYIHDMKKARLRREGRDAIAETPETVEIRTKSLKESLPQIDWTKHAGRLQTLVQNTVLRYPKEIGLGALIIFLAIGVSLYSTPVNRLHLYGYRLDYRYPKRPLSYLIGFQTDVKSWSEHNGVLDTPLDAFHVDETGTIVMEPRSADARTLVARPREWIITEQDAQGTRTRSVPPTNPSVAAGKSIWDRRGHLVRREGPNSPRVGRALRLIMPSWPTGRHRQGAQWDEPIEIIQAVGDWKIYWHGRLSWQVLDYQPCSGDACTHLAYSGKLTPAVWEAPAWAQGATRKPVFSGSQHGEALFDVDQHVLITNNFAQDGTLTIPISDVYRIPYEKRVGRGRGRLQGRLPGVIRMQITDRVTVGRQ